MNLEEKIADSVSKYLESGKIENAINAAIDRALENLTGNYGDFTTIIKKQLNDSITPLIESHDYSRYVSKLDLTLQNILQEKAKDSNKLLANFSTIAKEYPESINLSEIFEKYCKYAGANVDTTDLEIDYDDTLSYQNITCKLACEKYQQRSREIGIFALTTEEDKELNVEFDLTKWDFEKVHRLSITINPNFDNLKYLNEFQAYLLALQTARTKIVVDVEYDLNDEVEVEGEPEATF